MKDNKLYAARTAFDPAHQTDAWYASRSRQEALQGLCLALKSQPCLVGLSGMPGVGKSTLMDHFLANATKRFVIARISPRHESQAECLQSILTGFGFEPVAGTAKQFRHVIEAFFLHMRNHGDLPLIVVDDAQDVDQTTRRALLGLMDLKTDRRTMVNIILVGRGDLGPLLEALAQLAGPSASPAHLALDGYDAQELGGYVAHRLQQAGFEEPGKLFESGAVAAIRRLTGGIPALANTLCETAMSCAAARNAEQLTAADVDFAAGKLTVVYHGAASRVQGRRAADAGKVKPTDSARLVVTLGGRHVTEVEVNGHTLLIGRDPRADLNLMGKLMSRHHAVVLPGTNGVQVADVGSKNGVYVNSKRIRQQTLKDGDIVRVGNYMLTFLDPANRLPELAEDPELEDTATLYEPMVHAQLKLVSTDTA
jgi:type II secretory pathway predicted ATPase ExeA